MAKILNSRFGKVHRLANNPRQISDGAYTLLVESLSHENDIDFLMVKKLVVWKVPGELSDSRHWPFEGQEGKMVMLGGNQRYAALQDLGYDKIPDDWIIEGKHPNGDWWTPEEAERFILLDNNPEGISGETDYQILIENFERECLRRVGMDFAQMPMEYATEDEPTVEAKVQEGEHGEEDQKLKDFKKRREDSRGMVDEILDVGFYIVPLWETHDQKMQFLNFIKAKFGIDAEREVFVNGFELAKAMGLEIPYSGLKFPSPKPEKPLQDLAMDGTAEGYEVRDGEVPAGEEIAEDEGEKMPDGSGSEEIM